MRIGMGMIGDSSTGVDPSTGDTVICPPGTTFNPSNGNCDSTTAGGPTATAANGCFNAATNSYAPCVLSSAGTWGVASTSAAAGVPWYAWAALGGILLGMMMLGGRR